MELEQLFGLPAHPLLVHLPVVLIPIAGLLAIAMAVRRSWLDRFGWLLLGLAGVGFVGAVLAAGSGEALEESVKRTPSLERHVELGEAARLVSFLFFMVVVIVFTVQRIARRNSGKGAKTSLSRVIQAAISPGGRVALSVVLAVSAAAATVTMVQAGHQGAKATWENVQLEGEK
jgi:uncharacterized membrane protein